MDQDVKLLDVDPHSGYLSDILTRHRRRRVFFKLLLLFLGLTLFFSVFGALYGAYREALDRPGIGLPDASPDIRSILGLYFRLQTPLFIVGIASLTRASYLVGAIASAAVGICTGSGIYGIGSKLSTVFYEGVGGDIRLIICAASYAAVVAVVSAFSSSFRYCASVGGAKREDVYALVEYFMQASAAVFLLCIIYAL